MRAQAQLYPTVERYWDWNLLHYAKTWASVFTHESKVYSTSSRSSLLSRACHAGHLPAFTRFVPAVSPNGKTQRSSNKPNVCRKSSAISRRVVALEDLGSVYGANIGTHCNPAHRQSNSSHSSEIYRRRLCPRTYIAIASDRSSESRHTRAIQATFRG